MALPHPHGDSSGQIGHNANYSTTDTPGSTGGRFVGFGEQGTSAIANRSAWALSENIDYVYQIMAADRAIPEGLSYAVGGGGESIKQITGSIWVGDGTYPAAAAGLPQLFSVFDALYNELQDGSGNKVVVAFVRDSTNTTNVYQDGFVTDPVVTFKTVDSNGADVQNPYTIPAATNVKLLYAVQGSMENLPTDIFSKFKIISGEEVPAGTLLQDGSRAMHGNLDLNDNNLINVDQMTNVSSNPLDIDSDNTLGLSSTSDMSLTSSAALTLNDQFLTAAVPLSEAGETGLTSAKTSLVGALNSNFDVLQTLQGDTLLNRTGNITFTGATGQIDYPELVYTYNGVRKTTAAGNLTATAATGEYLVLNPSTGVVSKTTTPANTDIPLTKHYWDGATLFTTQLDLRLARNGRTRTMEVTVGDIPGADFASIQDALEAVTAAGDTGFGVPVLKVYGTPYYDGEIQITCPVKIVGDGTSAIICDPDVDSHGINCNGHQVTFENIHIRKDGGVQTAGYGAIANAGTGSVFDNVFIHTAGSGTWSYAFVWESGSNFRILIDKCWTDTLANGFLLGSSTDFSTPYVYDSIVRDTVFQIDRTADSTRGIVLPGSNNAVIRCKISTINSGALFYSMVGGDEFTVDGVVEESISDVDNATSLVFPDIDISAAWVRGCAFKSNGAIYSLRNDASGYLRLYVSDTDFYGRSGVYINPTLISDDDSVLNFANCTFRNGQGPYSIKNDAITTFHVTGCAFLNTGTPAAGIIAENSQGTYIAGNFFSGQSKAVEILQSGAFAVNGSRVVDNVFTGFTVAGVDVDANHVRVAGNHFYGGGGIAIYSAPTAADKGRYCNYVNNTCYGVGGEVDTSFCSTIYLNQTIVGAGLGCVVEGNILEECCTYAPTIAAGTREHIRVGFPNAVVSGNIVYGLRGDNDNGTSDTVTGIRVSGALPVVRGNKVINDFSVTGRVADTFYGILCAEPFGQVYGNNVHFYGEQVDANNSTSVSAISGGFTDNMMMSLNVVGDDTLVVSGATIYGVVCNGEEITAVGNLSYNQLPIWFNGGATTPGIVVGNVQIGGTVGAGSHNTTGNA